MTKCPTCAEPGAYVGFMQVECINARCPHYKSSDVIQPALRWRQILFSSVIYYGDEALLAIRTNGTIDQLSSDENDITGGLVLERLTKGGIRIKIADYGSLSWDPLLGQWWLIQLMGISRTTPQQALTILLGPPIAI